MPVIPYRVWRPRRRASASTALRPGPARVNQAPNTAMPSATEIPRRIRLP